MKPKIVEFQNGTFGVRRYSWGLGGYEFLSMNPNDPDEWWSAPYRRNYCEGTLEEAKARLTPYLDKGKIVREEELGEDY